VNLKHLNLKNLALTLALVCPFLIPARLFAAPGYFRVEQRAGVWWFVDPSGQLVISAGVDNVSYHGDLIHGTTVHPYFDHISKLYPSEDAWAKAEIARLRSWSFNNLGAWTTPSLFTYKMPYSVILDIGTRSGADWLKGTPLDVFDPRFENTARAIAAKECAPRAKDPYLLGYFSDNELRWGPHWRDKQNMLSMYLNLPSTAQGRQHAIAFLKEKYLSIQQLNQAWGVHATSLDDVPAAATTAAFQRDNSQFLGMVAERYFRVCADAIRAADPNHLYLGAKFAGMPPDPVLRASHIADVVSVDTYDFDPRKAVEHIYGLAQRPILVAEFAFRAENSGLPNTQGAGPKVPDQAARARAYKNFVTDLESSPAAVGYQWFEWCDEPKQGRFDGENSNYGLVNIEDQPYTEFVTEVKAANQEAISTHHKLMESAH
jgi:agarase